MKASAKLAPIVIDVIKTANNCSLNSTPEIIVGRLAARGIEYNLVTVENCLTILANQGEVGRTRISRRPFEYFIPNQVKPKHNAKYNERRTA